MKQTVLKYGFLGGGVLSALMVLTIGGAQLLGLENGGVGGMVVGYTTMVLSFLTIHFGVRSYRDTVLGGSVRFWPALRVGLLIALIGSACYAATWLVVNPLLLPDFAAKYGAQAIRAAEQEAIAGGKSAADVQRVRDEMAKFIEMYKNPFYNFGMTIMEPLPVGLLMSLYSAARLSRRRKDEHPVIAHAPD
jgi:hypothetical protein